MDPSSTAASDTNPAAHLLLPLFLFVRIQDAGAPSGEGEETEIELEKICWLLLTIFLPKAVTVSSDPTQ